MALVEYEAVIGLEIHAQLSTNSKLFSMSATDFGQGDNENVSPVCVGMPGTLPVLNVKAVEFAVKAGLSLNSKICQRSIFERKNYFYPDLPKGYQISQFEKPICEGGHVEFYVNEKKKRINLVRAHLEEDAGKLLHHGEYSLINFNRAGVPLLEIVSCPEMHSPQEAAEYARTVRKILRYIKVCDGNLEEGSLRCDCNISVRPKGVKELSTRVEIKNINSFRFIEKALQYEIDRQIDCVENGREVIAETRLYDVDKNRTVTMRKKEEAQDYRYFPDPDILPLIVEQKFIEKIRSQLPELPIARAERLQSQYKLSFYDAWMLTQEKEMADYFEQVSEKSGNAKAAANWINSELLRELKNNNVNVENSPLSAQALAQLIKLIDKKTISGKIAKVVFLEMWARGQSPQTIIKAKGLVQISDEKKIEEFVDQVISEFPDQAKQVQSGKTKVLGFFVGKIMKITEGKANPDLVNRLLKKKLK